MISSLYDLNELMAPFESLRIRVLPFSRRFDRMAPVYWFVYSLLKAALILRDLSCFFSKFEVLFFIINGMDKQKLELDVISAIKHVVDNVKNEQNPDKTSDVQISKTDCIAELGLESLELIALTEVLERQFNLGYVEVSTISHLTVEELCKKVVNHNVRIEVKKKLLKLLRELEPQVDFSSSFEEERVFWDWGFDSMDVENLTCEIEHRFDVDLSGCNLSDYTFGEVIDCIAERV